MHHVGEFAERGMLAHQDRDFLNDVGSVGSVGMTTEDEARAKSTVQTTPPFGHPSSLGFAALLCKELRRGK